MGDAARLAGDIALRCRGCRREVVVERRTFLAILRHWHVAADRAVASASLRCTACGRRGGVIELAAPDLPGRLQLHDGDPLPPKGMSISKWCKMNWHDRRRFIRHLRS